TIRALYSSRASIALRGGGEYERINSSLVVSVKNLAARKPRRLGCCCTVYAAMQSTAMLVGDCYLRPSSKHMRSCATAISRWNDLRIIAKFSSRWAKLRDILWTEPVLLHRRQRQVWRS